MAQMQLIQDALSPTDVIYTADWVAKDMVSFFQPCGSVLEPCRGDDAIYKYLPGAEWCEIQKGRDFFQWTLPVDWIITNPPYSLLDEFLRHALSLAKNIVFLMPLHSYFSKGKLVKFCWFQGFIFHIRFYGSGSKLGFPMGNPIAAFHFRQGYQGSTNWSWYDPALPSNNGVELT